MSGSAILITGAPGAGKSVVLEAVSGVLSERGVTHGEITSSITVPRCASAALSNDSNCFLSPLNERPTNVAPSWMARAQVSIAGRSLTTPVLSLEPRSAVAENWPLVRP